jgi:Raf kinase inhibitor-like YbhB/YbcL family protein
MRTPRTAAIATVAAALALTGCSSGSSAAPFTVASKAMPDGSTVANAQVGNLHRGSTSCDGKSQSPDLEWSGAPSETTSYAVIMHDPDAPRPGGVWHWVVFDIPAGDTSLPEGLPAHSARAKQALNTLGTPDYIGPCPPPGPPHHYVVTVYALDVPTLNLPDGAPNAPVRAAVDAHTLAKSTLTGLYSGSRP